MYLSLTIFCGVAEKLKPYKKNVPKANVKKIVASHDMIPQKVSLKVPDNDMVHMTGLLETNHC